jgi:hypothetical protein
MGAKVTKAESQQRAMSVVINKPEDGVYKAPKQTNTGIVRIRALVISISYKGTSYSLHGTIPDGKLMLETINNRNFTENKKEVLFMNDDYDKKDPRYPTNKNILRAIDWLLSSYSVDDFLNPVNISFGNKPMVSGTLALFYYSGHGMQRVDTNGDEVDGEDEVLCSLTPEGVASADGITDDVISQLFNSKSRKDCNILAITDCCHSGTLLDLKYSLKGAGVLLPDKNYKDSPGNILHIGACYDRQSAYEGYVSEAAMNHGYLTFAFSEIFKNNTNKNVSIFNLDIILKDKMLRLVNRANQLPQISSGNLISAYVAQFPF